MGWLKDGSYAHDDSDYKNIITQEKQWEAERQSREYVEREEARKKIEQKKQDEAKQLYLDAERNAELERREDQYAYNDKLNRAKVIQRNREYYGVGFDLYNPKTPADRIARADFWRTYSKFTTFVNFVNGKSRKFEELLAENRKLKLGLKTPEEKALAEKKIEENLKIIDGLFKAKNSKKVHNDFLKGKIR